MIDDRLFSSARVICNRRVFLGGTAALALTRAAHAEDAYPNRPVHIIIGFGAGGSADIIARVVATKMSEALGQQVLIENRPGAGGVIGTQSVARSPNDGYTLLLTGVADVINANTVKNLPYDFPGDFTPVSPLADTGLVLVVHPSLPVRIVADLIAVAKSSSDNLLYATAGKGSATHFAGEMFNVMAGTHLTPVHYKSGAETLRELITGEVKIMFSTIPQMVQPIGDGSLRGIATTGRKRDFLLPNLPTIAESGLPGYDMVLWLGLAAPANTPREIVDRLGKATQQALATPEVKDAMARQGYQSSAEPPAQFDAFIKADMTKWRDLVRKIPELAN